MQPERGARSGFRIAAMLLIAGLGAVAYYELPRWSPAGSATRTTPHVGHDAPGTICPPEARIVELRGDSHVIGSRMAADSGTGLPYGVVMTQALGEGVTARLYGRGGATAADGDRRWHDTPVEGDILLLAYGTNDSGVRGWMSGKPPVPLASYRASILSQIRKATIGGARVGLIAPPPASSPAMMDRLQPYRLELQRIGRKQGIPVFDPAQAFAGCSDREPLLGRDGLHLNQAGHTCLGQWLAKRLCR